jgi:hypothetical protein
VFAAAVSGVADSGGFLEVDPLLRADMMAGRVRKGRLWGYCEVSAISRPTSHSSRVVSGDVRSLSSALEHEESRINYSRVHYFS